MFKKTSSAGLSPKIPMLVGLLLLLAGVIGGVYLVQNRQSPTQTQADVGSAPTQVEVSNVMDNSFTVSWVSANPTAGFVSYGTTGDQLNSVARDKRDLMSSEYQSFQTHYVQVNGLTAGTDYYFVINSGKATYSDSDGMAYKVKTGMTQGVKGDLPTISGVLRNTDGGVEEGAIVLLSGPDLITQSTVSDESGNWTLLLDQALKPSLDGMAMIGEDDELSLRTNAGGGNSSSLLYGRQINDIPALTTGQTFDFRSLAGDGEKSVSKFNFIDDLAAQSGTNSQTINVWNPQESEALNTTQPLFIGTGPADTAITLNVVQGQTNVSGTVQSDTRGNWRWTASESLKLGSHIVRASYTNESGITFQSERRFSILGNSLGGPAIEASPSGSLAVASPSPTRTPSPTILAQAPTATPTVVKPTSTPTTVRVSPTVTVAATTTPSVTQTLTPTATVTVKASPTVTVKISPTATPTDETSELSPTPTVARELPVAATTLPTYVAGMAIGLLVIMSVFLLN